MKIRNRSNSKMRILELEMIKRKLQGENLFRSEYVGFQFQYD